MTRQPGLRPGEIVAALNNISSNQSEGDPLSDTSDCDFFYPLVCSSSESSDNEHEYCVPEQVQHSVEGKYHTKVVWLANHFYTLFHTYAIRLRRKKALLKTKKNVKLSLPAMFAMFSLS